MLGIILRRRSAFVAVLMMAGCLMVVGASSASAHAVLESSTPQAGGLLPSDAVVDRVQLNFDEPVDAAAGAIQVIAADGSRVDTGVVEHPDGDGAKVAVGVHDNLPEGSYLVVWRVVSADSHPVHDSFTFALGRAGSVADASPDTTASGVGIALGFSRFVGYAAVLVLVGVVCFFSLCWPAGWSSASRGWLIRGPLIAAAAAAIVGLGLQAAFDVGGSWSGAIDVETVSALLVTRFGVAHLIRLLLLLVIWVAAAGHTSGRRRTRWPIGVALFGVLVTVAIEGHSGGSLAVVALDVAHLAAAGAWFGGLTVLTVFWVGSRRLRRTDNGSATPTEPGAGVPVATAPPTDGRVAVLERVRAAPVVPWRAIQRFSVLAMLSVVLLTVTGVLQAIRQVPEWGALTGTSYGKLLLVKIGCVAVVLAGAAVSRAVVHRHTGSADDASTARLGRSVAVETLLLIAVLAVTSALVATPPARVDYRPTQDLTMSAGPLSVQLTAVPSAPMTMSLHLYTFGTNGLPAEVLNIQAEATHAEGTRQAITVPLLPAGTGHFVADQVLLPQVGTWTMTLIVRASTVDIYTTTATLTVR